MKKTLIVTAVAALAGSFATAASAQSSVTLYGLVDAGLTYVNNVQAPFGAGYEKGKRVGRDQRQSAEQPLGLARR